MIARPPERVLEMNDEAFVERHFAVGHQDVIARFHTPILAPGGEYQCQWQIVWPDREHKSRSCGIDGVQALMLAMGTVHSELCESDEYQSGLLTYLDQHDLDLPPSWGRGRLYDVGSPPE